MVIHHYIFNVQIQQMRIRKLIEFVSVDEQTQ